MTDPVAPGRVLAGRYRLVRPIARGGMASVWEGEDPLLSRRVAVKILDSRLGIDDGLRARFRHEAIAAARLAHPNVVATYDTGDDDGVAYIVMELVDGSTLREVLDERGPLPVGQAVAITTQVAAALEHAHAHGIVHRDIKPGNVLVQRDGHVKVTDFGIAKATDSVSDLTRSGSVMGTARYLAPEQLHEAAVDARADVYSLALVLYETLAGAVPFSRESDVATAVARLTADAPPLIDARSDVPPGLSRAIADALARDPVTRTPTARAFSDAISRHNGTAQAAPSRAESPPAPLVPRPLPPTRRGQPVPRVGRGAAVMLAILLFGAGVVAGFFGWRAATGAESKSATTSTTRIAAALAVGAVRDFDPLGDGRESPAQVGAAVDGDPSTAWTTEQYASANLGGAKSGVGLELTLDAPHAISAVEVDTDAGPWSADVYVSDGPFTGAPQGAPAARGASLGTHARLTLRGTPRGRYILLWITRLPETGANSTPFQLKVNEVRVLG